MLKWTVTKRSENGATDSTRVDTRRSLGVLPSASTQHNRENRRRSLGVTSTAIKRHPHRDKENHCLGTPYQPRDSFGPSSALRDVSNITPTSTPTRSATVVSGSRKRPMVGTAPQSFRPPQYASTLPTFDIEYSPCNLRTEPCASNRDLEIPDTYHEYPRYLPDDPPPRKRAKVWKKSPSEPCLTPLSHRLNELRFSKISFRPEQKRKVSSPQDASLSSSTMGDVTLDRMIDAILESAKKDKWTPINRRTSTFKNKDKPADLRTHFGKFREQFSVSPTYTPAEDPANDLQEFNSNVISPEKFLQAGDRTIILEESTVINEREVKTPDSREDPKENCCLRRQKAVRRKHHKSDADRVTKENREKRRCLIGLSLPNGIPSPGTPINFRDFPTTESARARRRRSIDVLAAMDTPEGYAIIVDSDPKDVVRQKGAVNEFLENDTSGIKSNELRASSTPTGASVSLSGGLSRRCLTFSPEFGDDSLEKRRSVASSTNSRYGRNVTGSLDLAIFIEDDNKLNIHGEWVMVGSQWTDLNYSQVNSFY